MIGSQSSGKSSLLNGIMAADILPLGEQMVTRTPLHLHLVNHATGKACWLAPRCSECGGVAAMKAEFGGFDSGAWKPHWEQTLTDPNPTTQVPAAYQQRTSSVPTTIN